MDFNIYIHQGNEYIGAEGKTISVGEVTKAKKMKSLTKKLYSKNELIPTQVINCVTENYCTCIAEEIYDGHAVWLMCGNDVAVRFYPDITIKGGNINLARAQQLIPGTTDITPENAAELVKAAGLEVHIRAEVQPKFTQMLLDMHPEFEKANIIVKDKIVRVVDTSDIDASTGTTNTSTNTVDTSTGSDNNGGSDLPPGNG